MFNQLLVTKGTMRTVVVYVSTNIYKKYRKVNFFEFVKKLAVKQK